MSIKFKITSKGWLFIVGWLFYLVFWLSKKQGVVFPSIIQSYLSDVLAAPLLLGGVLLFFRWYLGDNKFLMPISMILVFVIAISVVFEWFLPIKNSFFVSDPFDILAYVLGATFFYWIQKRSIGQKKASIVERNRG